MTAPPPAAAPLRVVRGAPTADELAAVTAVLLALRRGAAAAPGGTGPAHRRRAVWDRAGEFADPRAWAAWQLP